MINQYFIGQTKQINENVDSNDKYKLRADVI